MKSNKVKEVEELRREGWRFVGFKIGENSTWKPKDTFFDYNGKLIVRNDEKNNVITKGQKG